MRKYAGGMVLCLWWALQGRGKALPCGECVARHKQKEGPGWPFLLLLVVAQGAYVVAFGDAFGQVQLGAVAFADAVVAAHGDVAEGGDLFVGASGFLPGFYQGAVVEVDVQRIVGAGPSGCRCRPSLPGLRPGTGRSGGWRDSRIPSSPGRACPLRRTIDTASGRGAPAGRGWPAGGRFCIWVHF